METLTAALTVVIVLLVFALAYIDARTGYLPDVLTLPLGLVALLYHWSLNWVMFTAVELVFSSAVVGLVLLAVRYVGNKNYVQDSFGLGDVKFLASSTLLRERDVNRICLS
ncbi:prepilin peptidase [Kiloniella sp.]|uniref:prepilin peptidase n=1 Tax=Kiloniella sp. TaxID=1938587 RepID=UPI003B013BAB